ncbi:hypothetical protein [Roseiconus lacunae]|uniref:hypothetical protein n=1 Tax=Roseiconus lacunae TaxID=2605694 RepID=UPI0011F2678D|nr:hypothetical protein [Roseiconus lacunae]
MDLFDECSVLLPSATLDDFPTGGSDSDARSLLAGWTVLWHPLLLARTEQLPTWYRADAAPAPDGPRLIVVPDPSLAMVPADYRRKCDVNPGCRWITGGSRQEMLEAISIDELVAGDEPVNLQPLRHKSRSIAVDDFYAAGYLSLQIQIMTRRLRYTSNLDELHLQARIVEAAKAFCRSDADAAAEALHDVYDSLSEERDHYFSSDPHLVDLTLLTPAVLRDAIGAGWIERLRSESTEDNEADGVLGTPRNVLIDGNVAAAIVAENRSDSDSTIFQTFVEAIASPTIGWAGGGPASGTTHGDDSIGSDSTGVAVRSNCLDAMTMSEAIEAFREGTELARAATNQTPTAYARLSGSTPVDLVPSLAALGYRGVIPMDFTGGTGSGEESKLLIQSGNIEIEALTAKPVDASSDAAYLSIGAHLGEAIDGGEVATGLLVHWPDRVCDSHRDLVRAASWSLALGRFWTIDRYFTDGERPYHSGHLAAVSPEAADSITADLVSSDAPNDRLAAMADHFAATIGEESRQVMRSVAHLIKPSLAEGESHVAAQTAIAAAIGESAAGDQPNTLTKDVACFNPHGNAARVQVRLDGAPDDADFVYGVSADPKSSPSGNPCVATVDVPSLGFTRLHGGKPIKRGGLLKRITGTSKGIAEPGILRNEFMAVTLSEDSGGVSGVYSASRGNRMSMRLNAGDSLAGDSDGGKMICRELKTEVSNPAEGVIVSCGDLCRNDGKPIAAFEIRYKLQRGSRFLELEGTLTSKLPPEDAEGFFKRCFSVRTAVAGEASIMRALVRDKIHTTNSRRIVSPLGILIDEAEKQTLVCGYGLPLHRKVGDRFLDTVIGLAGSREERLTFRLAYGFDCPQPIAAARGLIAPPVMIPLAASGNKKTDQAWLVHTGSPDVQVTNMRTARRQDGRLACRMTLVQSRPKNAKVKLQFATSPQAAFHADEAGIERSLDQLPDSVRCQDGVVTLGLTSHEAADLIVIFDA